MENTVKRGEKGQNISELIGDEYKNWKPHWKYFISAPTGSGKTYFVLHVLLPYVVNQNQKMVYFVNRKILKDQLDKEISDFPYKYREAIRVETYQSLEQRILKLGFSKVDYIYPDPSSNGPTATDGNGYPIRVPASCHPSNYLEVLSSDYFKPFSPPYSVTVTYFDAIPSD